MNTKQLIMTSDWDNGQLWRNPLGPGWRTWRIKSDHKFFGTCPSGSEGCVSSPCVWAALTAYPIVEVTLWQLQGLGLKRLGASTPCLLTFLLWRKPATGESRTVLRPPCCEEAQAAMWRGEMPHQSPAVTPSKPSHYMWERRSLQMMPEPANIWLQLHKTPQVRAAQWTHRTKLF